MVPKELLTFLGFLVLYSSQQKTKATMLFLFKLALADIQSSLWSRVFFVFFFFCVCVCVCFKSLHSRPQRVFHCTLAEFLTTNSCSLYTVKNILKNEQSTVLILSGVQTVLDISSGLNKTKKERKKERKKRKTERKNK